MTILPCDSPIVNPIDLDALPFALLDDLAADDWSDEYVAQLEADREADDALDFAAAHGHWSY